MADYVKLTEDECAARLRAADALVLCHRNPDADTVGSALALCDVIRFLGGKAKAVCETAFPKRLAFMCGGETGEYAPGDEDGRCVIAVDVASPAQLGALSHLAEKTSLMIDHHGFGEPFADNLVCAEASSAGEIVTALLRRLISSGEIAPSSRALADTCRRLFAAVSSDTGSFKYSNATPAAFECAAYLVAVIAADPDGIDCADISRLLFDTRTVAELTAQRVAADKLRIYADGKLAITTITDVDCAAAGITPDDCSDSVDVPRSVAGAEVGIAIREKGSGEYRISARSNCDFSVAAVCASFGGGGHVRAAGASVFADSAEEAEKIVREAFESALEVYHG